MVIKPVSNNRNRISSLKTKKKNHFMSAERVSVFDFLRRVEVNLDGFN